MHSRTRTAAAIGTLAIAGALMLAGCGGSTTTASPTEATSTASAVDVGWNPPKPTGVTDDLWLNFAEDPATLTGEDLASACTSLVPPTTNDIDGLVAMAPASKAEEWTALYDYLNAYFAPLCANVAPAAESAEPSSEAAAEGEAAASGLPNEKLVEFVQAWCWRASGVFDSAAGTCSGLGEGLPDPMDAAYVQANLDAFIQPRFECPDGSDGAPSDECKIAYIDFEVAKTAEMLSDAG